MLPFCSLDECIILIRLPRQKNRPSLRKLLLVWEHHFLRPKLAVQLLMLGVVHRLFFQEEMDSTTRKIHPPCELPLYIVCEYIEVIILTFIYRRGFDVALNSVLVVLH